ncbi:MAG: PfkB family carbohydrate kinase [Bacillota bacterium]
MNRRRLKEIFAGIDKVRVGILGDFCLDVYWEADMTKSQLSRETAYYPLPIVRERISLGGAGNVTANAAALAPAKVYAFGVTGRDWRERSLLDLLHLYSVNTDGLAADSERFTNAFIKPLRRGLTDELTEGARLDFGPQTPLDVKTERTLLQKLAERMPELDALCVCDQLTFGCVTGAMRDFVCGGAHKPIILADSRERIGLYQNVIIKPNDIEACRALGKPLGADIEGIKGIALALENRTRRPVIVTMGGKGCVAASGGEAEHVPAFPVPPPIDICGAGDTFLAVAACALAAGATLQEAAWLANAGASITVQQLHTTGTASREALYAMCAE